MYTILCPWLDICYAIGLVSHFRVKYVTCTLERDQEDFKILDGHCKGSSDKMRKLGS